MSTLRDLAGPVDAQPEGQWSCVVLACAASVVLHMAVWQWWRELKPDPAVRPAQIIEVSLITIPSQSASQPQQSQGGNPIVAHSQPAPQPQQTRMQALPKSPRTTEKPPQKPIPKKGVKPQPRSAPRRSAQMTPLSEAGTDIPMAASPSSGPAVEALQTPSQGGGGPPHPLPFVEAVFRSPSLKNPPTQYPPLAIERQWEGRVILRVQVLAHGVAGQINIEHSSGHALLDDAAAQQVKNWHFLPARRGDQPVDSWVKVPIEFKLQR